MSGKSAVGRTGALRLYKYPEPRWGGSSVAYARNFATGPKTEVPVTADGVTITWNGIDVGTSPSPNVRITPLSTGNVVIQGVIQLFGLTDPGGVEIQILVDGTPVPTPAEWEGTLLEQDQQIAIPFLVEVQLTVGVAAFISVSVTADDANIAQLPAESSSMEIREEPVSTG